MADEFHLKKTWPTKLVEESKKRQHGFGHQRYWQFAQRSSMDKSIQEWHYTLGSGKSGDVLRKVLGGGPVAEQSSYKGLTTSRSSSTLSASASTRSLISAV